MEGETSWTGGRERGGGRESEWSGAGGAPPAAGCRVRTGPAARSQSYSGGGAEAGGAGTEPRGGGEGGEDSARGGAGGPVF